MIPFTFKYSYVNYPFSPGCTRRSKVLGFATCPMSCFLVTFVLALIVLPFVMNTEWGVVVVLAVAILARFPGKAIQKKLSKNIDRQAMADLLALEQIDPEVFRFYAETFKEELEDYRRNCGYQVPNGAPKQPHRPQQTYRPQQSYQPQQTPVKNYSPAANRVVTPSTSAFDIQEESAPEQMVTEPIVTQTVVTEPVPDVIILEAPAMEVSELTDSVSEASAVEERITEVPVQEASPVEDPVPIKIYCGKCGTKLKPDAAFCHHCGRKL